MLLWQGRHKQLAAVEDVDEFETHLVAYALHVMHTPVVSMIPPSKRSIGTSRRVS